MVPRRAGRGWALIRWVTRRSRECHGHASAPPALLLEIPKIALTDPEGSLVANIKSQIKRIATNEKARVRNKAVKSSLRTSVRRFREAAAAGDAAKATGALQVASRQLDKAASKGVIHQNQAANRKSAMAKRVASL